MQRYIERVTERPWIRSGMGGLLLVLLCGCASLPSSGPTGHDIRRAAQTRGDLGFEIVPLAELADVPAEPPLPPVFLPSYQPPPTDLIGTGDVLDIAIYEAGAAVFGGSAVASSLTTAAPTSQVERLPPYRVDDSGNIRVPYAGLIRAAGRTTLELESAIRAGLRGMSENPQVLVTIREVVANSVILGGEVQKPGRLVLPTNRETLSDVVALAGGYRGDAKDLTVKVQRQGMRADLRLSDLLTHSAEDLRVYPGDRISVIRQPWTFAVMGASGKTEHVTFTAPRVSLAEALASTGGTNPASGDPKAIFVFRFINEQGEEKPVVYHINMMEAQSYFVSQRFVMRDKDILYVGNARANQPAKFIQILSQLFTPVILARQLTD